MSWPWFKFVEKKVISMKTKVIVWGFGFMGQTHVGSLLKMADGELVAIVNPTAPEERLKSMSGNCETERVSAEEIGAIPHFRRLDDALCHTSADAAIVALPTKLHYEAVNQCLGAGLHVLVEKPFAICLRECELMVEMARKMNRVLAVGHVVRSMKEYQFLKQTIQSARLGSLKYLKLTRIAGIPNWGRWNDPEIIRASGGSLFDLVSHDIDFARFCLGEPGQIESVKNLGRGQFSMISSVLRYDGVDVAIEGGMVTPSCFPFGRSYAAFFERGTLLSRESGKVTEYRMDEVTEHDFLPDNPYFTEVEEFLHAVRNGNVSRLCMGEDAIGTIRCCTQIAEDIGYPIPASS